MKSSKLHIPLAWFAILAVIGTMVHLDLIDRQRYVEQQELHGQIITHTAAAPYQYRVLQPLIVEGALKALNVEPETESYKIVFLGGYAAIRLLAIFATYLAVFFALRESFSGGIAMLGTTALAAFLPFTYRYYYYQPTSILEMAFFGFGLLATVKRAPWAMVPLVALGTLNRETMCFIPLVYFLYWWPVLKRTEWTWLVLSGATWVTVFSALRVVWPASSSLLHIQSYIAANLHPSRGTVDIFIILAPALLVVFNHRCLPPAYARLALCLVPWIGLHFCTALWHEIRYYMPALIWLLPGLVSIFNKSGVDVPGVRSHKLPAVSAPAEHFKPGPLRQI